jgi:hypothetical protein
VGLGEVGREGGCDRSFEGVFKMDLRLKSSKSVDTGGLDRERDMLWPRRELTEELARPRP